jgi:hypothetical protein
MTDEANEALARPSKKMQKAFWWSFFLGAVFMGLIGRGQYFPDDSFDGERHILLASHEKCPESGCFDLADRWRNKTTGQTFSRREINLRWSAILFAYGLIGCFAFGYFRRHEADHAFLNISVWPSVPTWR